MIIKQFYGHENRIDYYTMEDLLKGFTILNLHIEMSSGDCDL